MNVAVRTKPIKIIIFLFFFENVVFFLHTHHKGLNRTSKSKMAAG